MICEVCGVQSEKRWCSQECSARYLNSLGPPPPLTDRRSATRNRTRVAAVRRAMPERVDQSEVKIIHGDCRDVMATLDAESVDAVITDPPYELAFMGKRWDASGIAFDPVVWQQCLRVLRPGGHLMAFGGTRTAHRLTCAIEDVGFEIRDTITWLYGSGFPKSLDVSKAIDKAAGAEREVIGSAIYGDGHIQRSQVSNIFGRTDPLVDCCLLTAPATEDARTWQGWGTALKPAHEPIIVARKSLSGTVAETVVTYGTGAVNIDACRVATDEDTRRNATGGDNGLCSTTTFKIRERFAVDQMKQSGRWPPNVVLTHTGECGGDCSGWLCAPECPVAELDRQSGIRRGGTFPGVQNTQPGSSSGTMNGGWSGQVSAARKMDDSDGASRFFPAFRYQAKASTHERPVVDDVAHPTVKPLGLMQWLFRLVTLPGGTVLDPFIGSGTTAEACRMEGMACIGIEKESTYLPLITARLAACSS